MKIWISAEIDEGIDDSFRIFFMQIEKELNAYLKNIGYENVLEKWRLVIILRDDDWSPEKKARKGTGENVINMRLKIPYNDYKDGDERTRKRLIYEVIMLSVDELERKKLKNLEPIREYLHQKLKALKES